MSTASRLWSLGAIVVAGASIAAAVRSTAAVTPVAIAEPGLAGLDQVPGPEIFQQLRSFRMMATVLHVGAHPDDENTQLIAALSRGRAVRTAYLSVTRGDGGQNLLGPELGYKLGLARTQELLAARRIDGGRQFFTRALDFGFSKDYLETFGVWNKDSILSDVVRVIRNYRPDVIITRFSLVPGGTHGHHTGSAVLAAEAFKVVGDPKAFPATLGPSGAWQPKRIFIDQNGGAASVRLEIGGNDPVLKESFASLAGRSRAMHKTQGFGQPGGGGGGGRGGEGASRLEGLTLLDGAPATANIFEGIDTTWARVPGGTVVETMLADAMATFDAADPSKSVPALIAIRKVVTTLGADPLVREKSALLDRIILECAGVRELAIITNSEVVPGETMTMTTMLTKTSSVPVSLVRISSASGDLSTATTVLGAHAAVPATLTLPATLPLTQPYWLRRESLPGMFRVDDVSLVGRPENPPAFPIRLTFDVAGERIEITDEPVQGTTDTTVARAVRRLDVIPPASVGFKNDVQMFAPGASHTVSLEVVANRPSQNVVAALDLPAGWSASPATHSLILAKLNEHSLITFTITAPKTVASGNVGVHLEIAGKRWNTSLDSIDYPHIPVLLLQPVANLKVVSAEVATRGKSVAYIPGAGDAIPAALEQLGFTVTQIPAKAVTLDALRGFDAVVIGIRASNVSADLGTAMPALKSYAELGGVVIEQYNQNGGLRNTNLGPFPLTVGGDRVTNENATVTFVAPDHPVLNTPNKITPADFDGWVQERGIYFPSQWAPEYKPILSMSDAGEAPLTGSLLIANVGKGYFVYTGLVFFRELPAGVPGSYRLFANLLALGRKPAIVP